MDWRTVFCAIAFAVVAGIADIGLCRAESRRFGDYEVFYSVFNSSFIDPGVAQALGIVRAPDRALLNVVVRRREAGGQSVAVAAEVEAKLGDLVRERVLRLREIREPGAIYYLGEFAFTDAELLYFRLDVRPTEDTSRLELEFRKQLFED